jgi:hypothetical protein
LFFWVHAGGTRWHFTSHPLTITNGEWTRQQVPLEPTPEGWHCCGSVDPERPPPLQDVLGSTHSYGFSFVGFSREVTGRLSLAEFNLRLPGLS